MIDLRYIESYVVADSQNGVIGLHELPDAIEFRLEGHEASAILEACKRACQRLVAGGFAELKHVPPHAERPARDDYVPVEEARAAAVLKDDRSYQSPRDERPRYFLTATEAGIEEYLSDEVISL